MGLERYAWAMPLYNLLRLTSSACYFGADAATIPHEEIQKSFVNFDKHGSERKLWLQRYAKAKSDCTWVSDIDTLEYHYDWFTSDAAMRGSYWAYLTSQMLITTYYPDLPHWLVKLLHFALGPASHGSALESQICITTSSAGERFRIRRLGPFISNGGFDWHKMKLQDPYQLRSQELGPEYEQKWPGEALAVAWRLSMCRGRWRHSMLRHYAASWIWISSVRAAST